MPKQNEPCEEILRAKPHLTAGLRKAFISFWAVYSSYIRLYLEFETALFSLPGNINLQRLAGKIHKFCPLAGKIDRGFRKEASEFVTI